MKLVGAALSVLLSLAGCAVQDPILLPEGLAKVSAIAETQPMDRGGDAADDPAIWLHPSDPLKSLVIGTQKRGGLRVYNLEGQLVQRLDIGEPNNVDLRYGVDLHDGLSVDLVAASNRAFNGISLFTVDPRYGRLKDATVEEVTTDLYQVYGICMGQRSEPAQTFVYATSRDGTVYQYRTLGHPGGKVGLEKVRVLKMPSQVEGCVVDDRLGRLFVGEEDVGIWSFGAWPEDPTVGEIVATADGKKLAPDIEGLTIAHLDRGGYLVASSQGNSTFAVFALAPPHEYFGSFAVGDLRSQDGASYTDGIGLLSTGFGSYSGGLLVVQDGKNTRPRENQNFKYVDWGNVAKALNLDLYPAWNPR